MATVTQYNRAYADTIYYLREAERAMNKLRDKAYTRNVDGDDPPTDEQLSEMRLYLRSAKGMYRAAVKYAP